MTKAVTINAPLSPQVMRQAQVPLEDALWLARQPSPSARMRALRTPRGEAILAPVRKFMHQVTASAAMPVGV